MYCKKNLKPALVSLRLVSLVYVSGNCCVFLVLLWRKVCETFVQTSNVGAKVLDTCVDAAWTSYLGPHGLVMYVHDTDELTQGSYCVTG